MPGLQDEDAFKKWLKSRHTGLCALSMAEYLTGWTVLIGGWAPRTPLGAEDLISCESLLLAVPELRARLGELPVEWQPIVSVWGSLLVTAKQNPAEVYPRLLELAGMPVLAAQAHIAKTQRAARVGLILRNANNTSREVMGFPSPESIRVGQPGESIKSKWRTWTRARWERWADSAVLIRPGHGELAPWVQ